MIQASQPTIDSTALATTLADDAEGRRLRVLLTARHCYPAGGASGTGRDPSPRATGGASIVHDLLAKGLAELGHDVLYHLEYGHDRPPPLGVRFIDKAEPDVDIHHYYNSWFLPIASTVHDLEAVGVPWIATCHVDSADRESPPPGHQPGRMPANWVLVSRTLAAYYGHSRYVLNGVDPSDLIYSTTKEDFLLFVSRAEAAEAKGIDRALALSRSLGFKLKVMAGSSSVEAMKGLGHRCLESGAEFVGDARGLQKAELFASARALLFPTSTNEAFGLVIAEALMSGTPVIASNRGACPELVTPDVGFICKDWDDYLFAIERIGTIRHDACRNRAMAEFHYLQMARGYVREYRAEIANAALTDSRRKSIL